MYISYKGNRIITINLGAMLALAMAYTLWGWKGTLFTLGLLMAK